MPRRRYFHRSRQCRHLADVRHRDDCRYYFARLQARAPADTDGFSALPPGRRAAAAITLSLHASLPRADGREDAGFADTCHGASRRSAIGDGLFRAPLMPHASPCRRHLASPPHLAGESPRAARPRPAPIRHTRRHDSPLTSCQAC